MMATFPGAASSAQQPPGPQDEDPSLDESDLYSLAYSQLGKAWPCPLPGPSTLTLLPQAGNRDYTPKLCGDNPSLPTPTRAPSTTASPPAALWPAASSRSRWALAGFPGVGGRKGRTKREAAAHTNRPSPGGHERKLVTKLQNTERNKRGARP